MKSTCSDCIGRSSGTALSPIIRKFGERILRPIRCPMAADRADGIISETAAGVADRLHLCFQHIPGKFRKDGDRAGVSRSHSAALRIPRLRSAEGGRGELFPKRQIAEKAEAMFHTCLMIAWFALPFREPHKADPLAIRSNAGDQSPLERFPKKAEVFGRRRSRPAAAVVEKPTVPGPSPALLGAPAQIAWVVCYCILIL